MKCSLDDIEYDDGMIEAQIEIDFMGQSYEVIFEAEIEDEENKNKLIEKFINQINSIIENKDILEIKILKAVLVYYSSKIYPEKEEYESVFGCKLNEISDPHNLTELISLYSVFVFLEDDTQGFGFNFSCDWDSEHGLGVRFVDCNIVKIGSADISFCMI